MVNGLKPLVNSTSDQFVWSILTNLQHSAAASSLLLLDLAGLLRETFSKAFCAGMLAVSRRVLFSDMIAFSQSFIAHGVFGVFETTAFEIDILSDAHGEK